MYYITISSERQLFGKLYKKEPAESQPKSPYHFVTKYRKKLLTGAVKKTIKEKIEDICLRNGYSLVRMEIDEDHIHLLIGYDQAESISKIVKKLK